MRSKPAKGALPGQKGRGQLPEGFWGRVRESLRKGGALLLCGLAYAALCGAGLGIGCPVYALTGLYCPSCGVSRLCMHLLKGEWREAFACNPAIFCLLPALALLLAGTELNYWLTGRRTLGRVRQAGVWCAVAGLMLFGILRNLPPFAALRPPA